MRWNKLVIGPVFNWLRGLEPFLPSHLSSSYAVRGSVKHYPQDGKPPGKWRTRATLGRSLCLPNRNLRALFSEGEEEGVKQSIGILILLAYLQKPSAVFVAERDPVITQRDNIS